MKTIFQLACLVASPPGHDTSKPWFITETILTSNGPRTRICAGRWRTQEEAQGELDKKERPQ